MSDPWAFGWTQVLTIIGFVITGAIAIGGFGTFERWRKQKLEEKKIEIAFEALAIAYECQFVFGSIRNPGTFQYEYDDMPREGMIEEEWRRRGPFYAILKRINDNRPYFIKVLQLQPRVMTMFGPETELTFRKLNEARSHVTVSAQMLMRPLDQDRVWNEQAQNLHAQCEADIWEGLGEMAPNGDRVTSKLNEFRDGLAAICRPVLDREYREVKEPHKASETKRQ
jgi:hypothetical protein